MILFMCYCSVLTIKNYFTLKFKRYNITIITGSAV